MQEQVFERAADLPTDLPPACRDLAIAAERNGVTWRVERYYHHAPGLTQTVVSMWIPALHPDAAEDGEPTYGAQPTLAWPNTPANQQMVPKPTKGGDTCTSASGRS